MRYLVRPWLWRAIWARSRDKRQIQRAIEELWRRSPGGIAERKRINDYMTWMNSRMN